MIVLLGLVIILNFTEIIFYNNTNWSSFSNFKIVHHVHFTTHIEIWSSNKEKKSLFIVIIIGNYLLFVDVSDFRRGK